LLNVWEWMRLHKVDVTYEVV
jgi:hypothetical protein